MPQWHRRDAIATVQDATRDETCWTVEPSLVHFERHWTRPKRRDPRILVLNRVAVVVVSMERVWTPSFDDRVGQRHRQNVASRTAPRMQ